jgi:hypothetical protein
MVQATNEGAVPSKRVRRWPWWVEPNAIALVFALFILYSLWAVLFQSTGQYHNYLSPFYSPPVGQWLHVPFPPAILVAWVPLLFRATCYFYRREYYRGFFRNPASCAVPEPSGRPYGGEKRGIWRFNNSHRYWWYLVVIVLIFLWIDTVRAFIFPSGFGVGVGSLLMLVNVLALTAYTFSCHAWRHAIGGSVDCWNCPRAGSEPFRHRLWRYVSSWNQYHGNYAWISLFTVWAVDVYIRLLIYGVIPDVRLIK